MENKCTCKEPNIDIYNLLSSTLEAKVKPLRAREEDVNKRLIELSDTKPGTILLAQIKVLTRSIEDAEAKGNETETKNFQTELAAVETTLEDIENSKLVSKAELAGELKDIESIMRTTGDQILLQWFEATKDEFIKRIDALLDMLDKHLLDYREFSRIRGSGNWYLDKRWFMSDQLQRRLKDLWE